MADGLHIAMRTRGADGVASNPLVMRPAKGPARAAECFPGETLSAPRGIPLSYTPVVRDMFRAIFPRLR